MGSNKNKSSLIKEAWKARKKWIEMEQLSLQECSFEERVGQCGYYKFIRQKIKGLIPLDEQYKGTPIGFIIKKI